MAAKNPEPPVPIAPTNFANCSPITWLSCLAKSQRAKLLARLSDREVERLYHSWALWARPEQLAPPQDWRVWLIMAGRGWGKTRTGAEWISWQVQSGKARRIALVAATQHEARMVMVEGVSGLLACCPPWARPHYEPSKRQLTWENGAVAQCFGAEEPDSLRGAQFDAAWCDELAKWSKPAAWDQVMFGLRLGQRPQVVVTTTPQPVPLIEQLIGRSDVVLTKGRTADNRANLAKGFLQELEASYGGTWLAAQELEGELLSDVPDTLWPARLLAEANVPRAPALSKVLLAIDPAVSSHADSAETGMVVVGLAEDGVCYVLQDASDRLTPTAIGKRVAALIALHKIDQLVVEVNQGGDWLLQSLNQADLDAVIMPVRAGQDKWARAEPVAMLYAQGRVKHVGRLPQLEAQMRACQRGVPNRLGMDRVDALVWAIRSLQRQKQRNFEIRTV